VSEDSDLADLLARLDPERVDAFRQAWVQATGALGMDDREAANVFGVSVPTAGRWRLGKTHPHPALIRSIYKRFSRMLRDKT
jgi:hypothetical protein